MCSENGKEALVHFPTLQYFCHFIPLHSTPLHFTSLHCPSPLPFARLWLGYIPRLHLRARALAFLPAHERTRLSSYSIRIPSKEVVLFGPRRRTNLACVTSSMFRRCQNLVTPRSRARIQPLVPLHPLQLPPTPPHLHHMTNRCRYHHNQRRRCWGRTGRAVCRELTACKASRSRSDLWKKQPDEDAGCDCEGPSLVPKLVLHRHSTPRTDRK